MYMINSTEAIQELEAEIREMPWMANAEVKVHLADDTGPYIQYQVVTKFRIQKYNPKYEASNPPNCECGHAYYRHFDPYENWAAVGCKHCACGHFKPAPGHWSRMERILHEASYEHYLYPDSVERKIALHILQWELFGETSLSDFMGISPTKSISEMANALGISLPPAYVTSNNPCGEIMMPFVEPSYEFIEVDPQ